MKRLAAAVLAVILGGPALADDSPRAARVDVNTATEEQLKAALGVGEEEARKIVEGRPYTRKDDLKDKKVLSADDYEKLKKLIDSIC